MARRKRMNIDRAFFCVMVGIWYVSDGFAGLPKQLSDESYPQFPDLVYEYRIAELNKSTPIELTYNQYVRRYIDIFTLERRTQVERFVGLSELYFPIFEDYLLRYDLPLELKYLAVVESGLNPLAKSPSNAIGLWQFLYPTAQMFDLQVTSYVDERCDVYKSTDAACRYLKYLYQVFGDWSLALAAYNGGPGELEKAISRSGGKTDFWDLYPYITESMRNYVPAFIAINYVFHHYDQHKLTPEPNSMSFYDLDTLQVYHRVTFANISKKIGLSEETIRQLNPCYRLDEIPDLGKPMILVLPKAKVLDFIHAENKIIVARKNGAIDLPENAQGMVSINYAVRKGDFLHKIAIRYGCTVDDICRWNNLAHKSLSEGTKLIIWTKQEQYMP